VSRFSAVSYLGEHAGEDLEVVRRQFTFTFSLTFTLTAFPRNGRERERERERERVNGSTD
jgi:hypothetical protein